MSASLAQQYQIHRAYIEAEGLDRLIDFQENIDYQERAFDSVSGALTVPFPPSCDDLVRLHKIIRARKCFTVLEFGLGYSTLVIADALEKNERDWLALPDAPEIRNRFQFKLFSLDASQAWIDHVQRHMPVHLAGRVSIQHSDVEIGTFQGQLCHFYCQLPDVVPDFIYLDGPAPKDVKGAIRGLTYHCDERTVMSGDLLLMESSFLPGTYILVDGRTNNARFLERNFTRQYHVAWDRQADVTTFELIEERLGKYNVLGSDLFSS